MAENSRLDQHDATSAENSHVYDTLDYRSSQLRLFTLLPSLNTSAAIRGYMTVITLPTIQQYEALSYVWGGDLEVFDLPHCLSLGKQSTRWLGTILMDTRTLKVSSILEKALRRLRSSWRPRLLWTDAVCIDQSCSNDKTHHVRLMHTIYRCAHKVLVWLGEHHPGFNGRYKYGVGLDSFHRIWCVRSMQYMWKMNTKFLYSCTRHYRKGSLPVTHLWSFVEEMKHFLTRVLEGLKTRSQEQRYSDMRLWGDDQLPRLSSAFQLNVQMYGSLHIENKVTLEELIYVSKNRQASDPRDHVYALCGLVRQPKVTLLEPDCSKMVSWAYQQAMVHIVRARNDLDFIVVVLQRLTNELSWCFDFSRKSKLEHMSGLQFQHRFGLVEIGATTGSKTFTLSHDDECGGLILQGTIVGKVSYELLVDPTYPPVRPSYIVDIEEVTGGSNISERCLNDRRARLLEIVCSFAPMAQRSRC
jgi:hypothetical protein